MDGAAIQDFLGGMFGTRTIELVAVACGFANVFLIIRRSVWNYPFGLVMVTLYCWIFYEYGLYSESLLQVYYFVIQLFGWAWWLNNREPDGQVRVRRLPVRLIGPITAGAAVSVLALGWVMDTQLGASLPYWDATTTVLAVIAQFLLAKRMLENWVLWIAVDILSIGIFIAKGLEPTAALYAVFLVLASIGLVQWTRAWQGGRALPA